MSAGVAVDRAAVRAEAETPDELAGERLDATLVADAKRDRRAFAPLYQRYVGPVYRYCAFRLGSREAAEDACSLVFTKALAALPTCRETAFRSWLFTIAHNVVTDTYRSRRPTTPLTEAHDLIEWSPTPEACAIANDERQSVHLLLAQLPPDQARVLELRLAGLTDAEIGRVLGRSPGAIRSLQFRAVSRLRRLLGVPSGKEGDDVPS